MAIRYVSGDLFENHYNVKAFAHGCNCKGAMGVGIAKGFRQRYPQMYKEYKRRCSNQPRQFNLGDCFLWKTDNKPLVFNLATQEHYWRCRANYDAVEQALENMKHQADEQGINSIAIPRIAAGYGGLSWSKVKSIIERIFSNWSGTLYVYEEYVPGE